MSAGRVRWADLRLRVLSAAVLVPVALACLWFGGWAWVALVALGSVGLALEWCALCGLRGATTCAVVTLALLAAGAAVALGHAPWAMAALALGMAAAWLTGRRSVGGIGVWYVGLPMTALLWLRADEAAGWADVLFVLLVVWSCDIGAYLVGRLVGGPKLAPRISPGKTWSGAVGGLLVAVAVGWLTGALLAGPEDAPAWRILLAALVLAAVSQAGDLMESAIKRHFGVKDLGRLIPGHGGLLDRLDGVLAAAPVAALMALMHGRGVVLWQ